MSDILMIFRRYPLDKTYQLCRMEGVSCVEVDYCQGQEKAFFEVGNCYALETIRWLERNKSIRLVMEAGFER